MEAVPLDRIRADARQIHPARTFLLLVAGLFFGVGWLAAKTFVVLWAMVTFIVAAVKAGWAEARPKPERGG